MLAMQYTGDGEAERGMNPPKQYRAEYAAGAGHRRRQRRRQPAVSDLDVSGGCAWHPAPRANRRRGADAERRS